MSFDKKAYMREYMAKKRAVEVHAEDMAKCPKDVDPKEWQHACERAARAKRYAETMLGQSPETVISTLDSRFQDPLWQWENEVRGRFTSVVGGSLSGSRSHPL